MAVSLRDVPEFFRAVEVLEQNATSCFQLAKKMGWPTPRSVRLMKEAYTRGLVFVEEYTPSKVPLFRWCEEGPGLCGDAPTPAGAAPHSVFGPSGERQNRAPASYMDAILLLQSEKRTHFDFKEEFLWPKDFSLAFLGHLKSLKRVRIVGCKDYRGGFTLEHEWVFPHMSPRDTFIPNVVEASPPPPPVVVTPKRRLVNSIFSMA